MQSRHRRGRELDEFDFALIAALRQDPRLPNNSLGKLLKVTHVTIRDRINRLLRNGFIRILPVAEPRAFGYDREIVLMLRTQPAVSTNVAESITSHPAVRRVQLVMGSSDVLVDAVFREESDLLAFMRMVTATAGIVEIQTNHVIGSYKNDAEWAPQPLYAAAEQESTDPESFWARGGISLDSSVFDKIQIAAHWLSAFVAANVPELERLSATSIALSGRLSALGIAQLTAHTVRLHRAHPEWSARIIEATAADTPNTVLVRWVGTGHHIEGEVSHGLHVTHVTVEDGLVTAVHETGTILTPAQVQAAAQRTAAT